MKPEVSLRKTSKVIPPGPMGTSKRVADQKDLTSEVGIAFLRPKKLVGCLVGFLFKIKA
jgi:hypothetical protein